MAEDGASGGEKMDPAEATSLSIRPFPQPF